MADPSLEDQVVITALEEAAAEILSSPASASGVSYGPVDIDLEDVAERLGMSDDVDIYDVSWGEWFSAHPKTETLIEVSKEPRGGMLTYNYAVVAVELPSGRHIFAEYGDMSEMTIVAAADAGADDELRMRFLQQFVREAGGIDIPVWLAGDLLDEIDLLWALVEEGGFILEALTEEEADWMSDGILSQGADRRSVVLGRAEELLDIEGESDELGSAAYENVATAPPWFYLLTEADLDEIASMPLPGPDRRPLPIHVFGPWERPRAGIFSEPQERKNLQHIVAAFVLAQRNGRLNIW